MPITEANRKKNNKRTKAGRAQIPEELIPTTPLKNAFKQPTPHPQVGKGNARTSDGIRLDSKQSHHLVPVDSFTSFTEGFTPEQIKATRLALEKQGLIPGDHMLNNVELWGRYHQGKTEGPYKKQGAHQKSNDLKIDGAKAKQRWKQLSPEERFAQLDSFVGDMVKNRQIAMQSDFASRQLLGSSNTPDNEFGGNFTQRILSSRNADNAARNAANTKAQRQLYTPSVPREPSPIHNDPKLKIKPNNGRRSSTAVTSIIKDLQIPRPAVRAASILPAASLITGFGQASHAAMKGDIPEAIAHGVGAVVGEVPVIGDVAVESFTGSPVADGTVKGVQQDVAARPSHYGKNGPDLTTPEQSNRAALLRKDPSQERGYETIQRGFTFLRDKLKSFFK